MKIKLSESKQGIIGIAGHVGCGHLHSHNYQVQDDSCGLATVLALFQEATGLSLVIKELDVHTGLNGFFEVRTMGGGYGTCKARRGITLQEANLAKTLIGRDAKRTQTIVIEAFGRFYGQGIHEAPVALQTAIANAALDTFVKAYPNHFKSCYEDQKGSCGLIAGAVLDFDEISVSVLGTVNASEGGIGPNEDLEGNSATAGKKKVMADLGMMEIPTIIVETMNYSPTLSPDVSEVTFLVREDPETDNPVVAYSIVKAAESLDYPVLLREDVMKRIPGGMDKLVKALGEKIVQEGTDLLEAEYSHDKVDALARLAVLVSQDGGGISFMTNKLNGVIGGAGMMPGTAAVVSCLVPVSYYEEFIIPFLTEEYLNKYVSLVIQSVKEINKVLPEAQAYATKRKYTGNLDDLIFKG